MNTPKRKLRNQRGLTLAPVMLFTVGFTTIGVGILSMSVTYNKGAKKTTDKWQSSTLAESATNVLYDQIRMQMISDQAFPFSLAEKQVTVPVSGVAQKIGKYSATVVSNREVQTDVTEGGTKYRKFTYYFTLEGKGQAQGGVESVVQARFKAEMYRNMVLRSTYVAETSPTEFGFPTGAIVSNTKVNIKTNQGLRTYSPDGCSGHVVANDGISWNPSSGTKAGFSNPNILDIQGYWLVPSGGSYTSTTGASGLGNSNGTTNYRSPAAPKQGDFPGAASNSVIKLENKVGFAGESTVNSWANDWLTNAKGLGTTAFPGSVASADVPTRASDGKKAIVCPATIEGGLNVANGDKIELFPISTNPKKNVIYVKGDVKNYGQIINHGVTLVFEGKYEDDSDAEYKLEPDSQTFKTREMVLMRAALLSLNKSSDSFKFHTNSSATVGLVYSTKGGIQVDGANAEFSGLLLAGGTGTNGGINIEPGGGNSFVVKYEPYAATGGEVKMDAASIVDSDYVAGNVARAFTPTKLVNWLRVK